MEVSKPLVVISPTHEDSKNKGAFSTWLEGGEINPLDEYTALFVIIGLSFQPLFYKGGFSLKKRQVLQPA